ncbi:MAG: hypothetical protein H2174_05005 [Vampirovibrio sp.]|nr:hypothetical protein [Vampirovibrio sp.]
MIFNKPSTLNKLAYPSAMGAGTAAAYGNLPLPIASANQTPSVAVKTNQLLLPADLFQKQPTPILPPLTITVPITPFTPQELQQLAQQPAIALKWMSTLKPKNASFNQPLVESVGQRMAMALRIYQALPAQLRPAFQQLLDKGVLTQTQGEANAGHSTLYYLYALANTPRYPSFSPSLLLADAVGILANPDSIEQENTPLNSKNKQLLVQYANHPTGDKHAQQRLPSLRIQQDVDVIRTFNCAMAAELSRMASQQPTSLVRQFVQLSSPNATYYQVVSPQAILPEAPQKAEAWLKKQNFTFQKLPTGHLSVEMPAPKTGLVRALNTQQRIQAGYSLKEKEASPLMVLYQTTLLYNAVRKDYDVAADKRDTLDLGEVTINSVASLTQNQKNVLLSILQNTPKPDESRFQVAQLLQQFSNLTPSDKKAILTNLCGENQGITPDELQAVQRINAEKGETYSITTFQVLGPPVNATHETENDQYLYGYVRSFEQIQGALLTSLQAGKEVIISKSFALPNGYCLPGHEVKIKAFQYLPSTQPNNPPALYFGMADSDDDAKGLKWEPARELVPLIHHASLPESIAKQLWTDILAHPYNLLVPDGQDAINYQLMPMAQTSPPEGLQLPSVQKQLELQRLSQLS